MYWSRPDPRRRARRGAARAAACSGTTGRSCGTAGTPAARTGAGWRASRAAYGVAFFFVKRLPRRAGLGRRHVAPCLGRVEDRRRRGPQDIHRVLLRAILDRRFVAVDRTAGQSTTVSSTTMGLSPRGSRPRRGRRPLAGGGAARLRAGGTPVSSRSAWCCIWSSAHLVASAIGLLAGEDVTQHLLQDVGLLDVRPLLRVRHEPAALRGAARPPRWPGCRSRPCPAARSRSAARSP